jgi:hypothetical protein
MSGYNNHLAQAGRCLTGAFEVGMGALGLYLSSKILPESLQLFSQVDGLGKCDLAFLTSVTLASPVLFIPRGIGNLLPRYTKEEAEKERAELAGTFGKDTRYVRLSL